MSQFDLIDDYLTHRLSGESRRLFEQKMQEDIRLKEEVNFQKSVIEGIKKARINELKAMLNNTPVGGASALSGKLALAALSVGILTTLIYYLGFKPIHHTPVENPIQVQEAITKEPNLAPETSEEQSITDPASESPIEEKIAKANSNQKSIHRSGPPKIDVVDPTEEIHSGEQESESMELANRPLPSTPSIEVDIDNTHKTYSFHYQFIDDRLVLYGPFNSGLYEIIEINGTTQTAFLFYNGKYYQLDEKISDITPLIMIRDNALLKKLDQYRSKN